MSSKALELLLVAALALPACADDPLTLTDGPDPSHEPEMFRAVLKDLTQPKNMPQQGDWPDDFGDANFYGPGFFFRYGEAGDNQLHIDLARQNQDYNAKLLAQAMQNLNVLMTRLEDVLMASFGLMEAYRHQADEAALKQLDQVIEILNMVGKAIGYYPENSSTVGGYGVDTYGPTTTNSSLALLNLEYALQVGGAKKQERITTAKAILAAGRTTAFDSTLGYYTFSSTVSGLYLYPNITQMICHLRVYELTGEKLYLDRARDLHRAIQPLKVKDEGRYRSPYSAKYMGAKTDDYTTFSSQNFVMIGLSLLYKFTQDAQYKQEITKILEWLRIRLLQGGRVLHHWMDGKLAKPTDPEYYCSGCNLQLLYILHRMDELLAPTQS